MTIYDVGIIGLGVAGSFAAMRLSTQHKKMKVLGIDLGRPPMKRKQWSVGWLGCLPNSDGKLYQADIDRLADITGLRRAKTAHTQFRRILSQVGDFSLVKDRAPLIPMEKKIDKAGYQMSLNDYIPMFPREIHLLSKYMSETIEENSNVEFSFDNEILHITKSKGVFVLSTEDQEYRCKKVIMAAGRAGWRWVKGIYAGFGLIDSNDVARFGVRIECNSSIMKDFNKSNCTITKEGIEIGPLSWHGTVIPEDHLDMAISAFRSNEVRWKTDKVSFNLIGDRPFPNSGFEQTDRLGKLTFVLSNDRILKERVSSLMHNRSKISIIPEYNWLKDAIRDFAQVIPEITTKAYFHVPTIVPIIPNINLGDNLETELDGLFAVGESAGVMGILAAGVSGIIAADAICQRG